MVGVQSVDNVVDGRGRDAVECDARGDGQDDIGLASGVRAQQVTLALTKNNKQSSVICPPILSMKDCGSPGGRKGYSG